MDKERLAYILQTVQTIAVVGASPKPERPSHFVARYLIEHGYNVIPVNPGQKELFGRPCYPSLFEIPEPVDLVDIFRRPEEVEAIVRAAIQIEAQYVWMQEGIAHEQAAALAREHGLGVVENLCIKKMHQLLTEEGLLK